MSLRFVFPVLLALISALSIWYIHSNPPTTASVAVEKSIPIAHVRTITPKTQSIPFYSRGLLEPTQEVALQAKITGTVTFISTHLAAGRHFKKGDVLAKIDSSHATLQQQHAKTAWLTAKNNLNRLQAEWEAERAFNQRFNALSPAQTTLSPPEHFYQEQIYQAEAQVTATYADYQQAQQQSTENQIVAPFNGRVRMLHISQGQNLTVGVEVARVYAIDQAHIRLALTDRQWALLPQDLSTMPAIALDYSQPQSGQHHQQRLWGVARNAQGSIDPINRLRYLIVDIDQGFDSATEHSPQLTTDLIWAGQWMNATLLSPPIEQLATLPSSAVHQDRHLNTPYVWWVDDQNQLQRQSVTVFYQDHNQLYVQADWHQQQRILVEPLVYHLENMPVQPIEAPMRDGIEPIELKTHVSMHLPKTTDNR